MKGFCIMFVLVVPPALLVMHLFPSVFGGAW